MATPTPTGAVNVVRQWDDHQLVPTAKDAVLPWELGLEHLDLGRVYWNDVRGSNGARIPMMSGVTSVRGVDFKSG